MAGKLRNGIIVAIVAAVVGSGGTFVVSKALLRPKPIADLNCAPKASEVGQIVECTNYSHFSDNFQWKFDTERTVTVEGKMPVRHAFQSPGKKIITVIAFDYTGKDHPSQSYEVNVREPQSLANKVSLSVFGITPEQQFTQQRTVPISQTKDDHPVTLSSHSRTYSRTFSATPGYKITNATFQPQSVNNASDILSSVDANGRSVTVSYRLTSGPQIDRYRGWIRGDVSITEEAVASSHETPVIAELIVDRLGEYSLPVAYEASAFRELVVKNSDGRVIGRGNTQSAILIPSEAISLRFTRDGEFTTVVAGAMKK